MNIYSITTTWLERDNHTIIAMSPDNKIMGTVMVDYHGGDKKEVFLWNLWVEPQYRKSGLAMKLIDEVIAHAKSRKCKAVYLKWNPEDTPGWTLDWYKRIGFKFDSFTFDSVRLKKVIR